MYEIILDDTSFVVDNGLYIKLHEENGSFVLCSPEEAEGICVKVPTDLENEEGATITTCVDTVYAIVKGGLHGTEPLCTFKQAQVAMEYYNALKAEEIVSMLEEVM